MHAYGSFVAVLMALSAIGANAGTLGSRQLGGLTCNIARIRIVTALGQTKDEVGSIKDTAVADKASTGLDQAGSGIGEIAKALLSGEDAPAASRDKVAAGLTAAGTALKAGDQTDEAVTNAMESLQKAKDAGQDVVSDC
ncbi:hypothetical protein F4780DRAFT_729211 [Xylariomycetidae sp. FL0641]|nr:hypothetical protein F4780DRAFT_729211 [Xylariomycetidae sp. FL0641]